MKHLSTLFGFIVLIQSTSLLLGVRAQAEMTMNLPELHVSGMQQDAGRTITVFYVSAAAARVALSGQPLQQIRSIQGSPVDVRIDSGGNVDIPAVSIPRASFNFDVVNFIVLSAEPGAEAFAKDSTDDYGRLRRAELAHISMVKVHQLESTQGNSNSVQIQFGGDFSACRR